MTNNSEIMKRIMPLMYPLIILFGIYLLMNGHMTPGGGFQGGAVLTSYFIIQYLIQPDKEMYLSRIIILEKVLFLLIILLPCVYLFYGLVNNYDILKVYYMILMNGLIGIKVFCGMTIIFFRFVLFESR